MSDSKSIYSAAASIYVTSKTAQDQLEKLCYEKSKAREAKHNEEWKKHFVNLNDIVNIFAPDYTAKEIHGKFIFKSQNGKYNIIADMSAGYLRIYNNEKKRYVKLDGTPGNDKSTHYKIKKRENM